MTKSNTNKKTLVIGASLKPSRYSNIAIQSLVSNKIPTLAIGLKEGEVAGVKIETKQVICTDIHTITLYLNPQRQIDYYDYILSLKPERVIFNPGTENPELMSLLDKNQVTYEIACTLTLLSIEQF